MTGQYPLDFDSIKKGDDLTPEQLADITGKKHGTREYEFAVLALQMLIQEKTGFTVKGTSDGGLRVLTDPEAAIHNAKIFRQHLRGLGNRLQLNSQVDPENLTAEDRKKHERNIIVQSRYVSAVVKVRSELSDSDSSQPKLGKDPAV